ncbi:ABC transporter substrate-binding protein [Kribbella speibonae]|uniref:ABC transporter substrate-binding protein n=1 Tax=Kribbella speibonae TaxID=1572660 RepID=A0ABY2A702_9ACTN|nr:ABC transporter substrate-binding protein [Kribbella speibonae]TCC24695.1 ABC transporter substrate-binding protein [Kribbella speibonae]
MSTVLSEQQSEQPSEDGRRKARVEGGTVTWACNPGFPPAAIFPFTPRERIGIRNLYEFQVLMFRPLYWLGCEGRPEVNPDLSLAYPPEWSEDGLSVTVTLKPWQWSNGEPICADNVMFWVNMMAVKGDRLGYYVPGYFPDNLSSYEKVAEDKVRFTFDEVYSKTWVEMNQLSLITPMPKAWDRTASGPARASYDVADIPAVYDYLVAQNGEWTVEANHFRGGWAESPVWSVVNGPWRLKSYTVDGVVTFVPNDKYSGPNKPHLDEFRQVQNDTDELMYERLLAGPDAPDGIQIGYLPFGMGLTDDGEDPLADSYRLVPQDVFVVRYMPFNFDNDSTAARIYKHTYVRQALQMCLDQDRAIREIYHGNAYRMDGPVPPSPANPHVSPKQRKDPMPFDVDAARELLEAHGWDTSTLPARCVQPGDVAGCSGDGVDIGDEMSFTIRYVEGKAALTRLLEMYREDAAKAGIELKLEPVYGSVMVAEDHSPDVPSKRLWEINTWNGGWSFYGHLTGEMLFRTGGGSNFGDYSDPKADELIDRTVHSDDPEAMYAYQDYIAAQVPTIWSPGFPNRMFEVAKNLQGIEPINPYGLINPEDWYYVEK